MASSLTLRDGSRWGLLVIGGAFSVSLLASFWIAVSAESPWWALAVPGGLAVVASLGLAVPRHPLIPLGVTLSLAALALDRSTGVSLPEIAFIIVYFSHISGWFCLRIAVYQDRVIRDVRDAVLALAPLFAAASLAIGLLDGATLLHARQEWIPFSMLWLYFPVREACERYRQGPTLVSTAFIGMATASVIRNTLAIRKQFANAEYAWEVARARATSNEILILVAALLCLAIVARSYASRSFWYGLIGFAVFTLGTIATQWRGYYIALALGVIVILFLAERRGRLLLAGIGGLSGLAGIAFLFLGDTITLVALGLLDRVLSIGTATTVDISLINRWFEVKVIWSLILQSPIIGHGIGTTFGFFDATTLTTWVKPYSHMGYLHLWYKFGIIGLAGSLWAWGRSAWDGWVAFQTQSGIYGTLGLFVFVSLIALVPSTLVSVIFSSDAQLCFAMLMGVGAGCRMASTEST